MAWGWLAKLTQPLACRHLQEPHTFEVCHCGAAPTITAHGLAVPFAHVALIIMHGLAAFIACAAILAGAIGPMFGQVVCWALGIAANTA